MFVYWRVMSLYNRRYDPQLIILGVWRWAVYTVHVNMVIWYVKILWPPKHGMVEDTWPIVAPWSQILMNHSHTVCWRVFPASKCWSIIRLFKKNLAVQSIDVPGISDMLWSNDVWFTVLVRNLCCCKNPFGPEGTIWQWRYTIHTIQSPFCG